MLVLARKLNESIMIGDDIEIVIIDIRGDQVKLGIKAPKSIAVHRKEIYDEIKGQNIEAAAANKEFKAEDLRALSDFFSKDNKKKDSGKK